MSGVHEWALAACTFLVTYFVHSTVMIAGTMFLVRRVSWFRRPTLRVLAWKSALLLPVMTTFCVAFFPLPHFGFQLALGSRQESLLEWQPAVASASTSNQLDAIDATEARSVPQFAPQDSLSPQQSEGIRAPRPPFIPEPMQMIWTGLSAVWGITILVGFVRLALQARKVRQLRDHAHALSDPSLLAACDQLRSVLRINRPVAFLESQQISGAMTSGILHPFVVVEAREVRSILNCVNQVEANGSEADSRRIQWKALVAHELAHIAHGDAVWNLAIQLVQRLLPFQPLNGTLRRQTQIAMDFAADERAAGALRSQSGLVQCLIRMGDQVADRQMQVLARSGLVAGMVAFRSTLGQRIEMLLASGNTPPAVASFVKVSVLSALTCFALGVAVVMPQAVTETRFNLSKHQSYFDKEPAMKSQLMSLAMLVGLTGPMVADEPSKPATQASSSTALKTTPDDLPDGIRQFNGMLVGRLGAKDVEKGTFVVTVDAVPRVWRNSQAKNPKSIVGKSVQVSGVFGRFLDVLVTTRPGETIEFECKHSGDALVFPGELLRKVAAYDASDYPVLPEAFRGFHGAVAAEIKKKDPETFELIVDVQRVTNTSKESSATNPQEIVGKPMMLAGFWNRKDAYHKLKVGDRIEVGVQHIGRQSDHLTVTEFVRDAGQSESKPMDGEKSAGVKMSEGVRGFSGMLVGRLLKKDVERGTFTITVDAVPRVWKNNQASAPKSLIGQQVNAQQVPSRLLDALVVARLGDTIEFGALGDDGNAVRVGEVLRKVAPVEPGDYPVLPDAFRGFNGTIIGKVTKKNDHLWELIVDVTEAEADAQNNQAQDANSIVSKQVMLSGFWNKKDAYYSVSVGDRIQASVEHPQKLSDHLSVTKAVRKLGDQ